MPLEAQLGTLRHKLEQKAQLEAAIEGKHSKLTEVYKALETECQNELNACREASGQPAAVTAAAAAAAAAAADGDAGGEASRKLSDGAGDGCGDQGLHGLREYLRLGAALLLGLLLGSAAPAPALSWLKLLFGAGGAQLRRRTTPHVEEMRGWMPTSVAVPGMLDDMKLS